MNEYGGLWMIQCETENRIKTEFSTNNLRKESDIDQL